MKHAILWTGLLVASAPIWPGAARAAEPAPPAKPSSFEQSAERTLTGQLVTLPQGPVVAVMRLNVFPAGFKGPLHKQPYQRYAYVLSGRLRVTYDDPKLVREFGPGEMIVEGVDQWHWVEPVGPGGVRVLTIDQTPPGAPNVVIKQP